MTFIDIFGYVSGICFFVGYIPQLLRTYRLKSVDDLSTPMWVLTLIAYLAGFVYGVELGRAPLILSYSLGMGCTILMLTMITLYRDPRKDQIRNKVRDFLAEARRNLNEEKKKKGL